MPRCAYILKMLIKIICTQLSQICLSDKKTTHVNHDVVKVCHFNDLVLESSPRTVTHDCVIKHQTSLFLTQNNTRGQGHLFILIWFQFIFSMKVSYSIFSPSSSGSNLFVLFNSLDRNGALFANVLCDMPHLFNWQLWMKTHTVSSQQVCLFLKPYQLLWLFLWWEK